MPAQTWPADEPPPIDGPTRPTHVRYLVLAMLAVAPLSAYLTRVLGAANTTISAEFGIDDQAMGYILAGFGFGYFWFQIPGGWLTNRFGNRATLATLCALWSLCAIWGSFAPTPASLRWSRVALGIAQAGLVPCCAKVVSDWLPDRQRGLGGAVMTASMQGGAFLATGVTAALITTAGWRYLLLAYSCVGLIWSVVFFIWFRNRPEEHSWTNAAECDTIREGRTSIEVSPASAAARTTQAPAQPPDSLPPEPVAEDHRAVSRGTRHLPRRRPLIVSLLFSLSAWAICLQAFFRAFGYEFFTTWFAAWLEKGQGLKLSDSGQLGTIPFAAVAVGSLFGGWLIDRVLVWTGSRWLSRSGISAFSLILCAGCMLLAGWCRSPVAAVAVISCGAFLSALSGPGTWAATMDISGRHTAVMFGLMNMVGNMGAFVSPIAVGYLFTHIEQTSASWNLVLYLFVGVYLLGAFFWLILNPNRPIDPPVRGEE